MKFGSSSWRRTGQTLVKGCSGPDYFHWKCYEIVVSLYQTGVPLTTGHPAN